MLNKREREAAAIVALFELGSSQRRVVVEGLVELQCEVWGFSSREAVPSHTLIAAGECGGLVLVALDKDTLAGFCFSLPAWDEEGRYHYIHMIGTLPRYRNRGIALKLARRHCELSLAEGIRRAQWTYDPLEAANAWLYIEKLGATARGPYLADGYPRTEAGVNPAMPRDRMRAHLTFDAPNQDDPRRFHKIPALTLREIGGSGDLVLGADWAQRLPRPCTPALRERDSAFVEVPPGYQRLKDEDLALAMEWRLLTRAALSYYLGIGLVASEYLSFETPVGRRNFYCLRREGVTSAQPIGKTRQRPGGPARPSPSGKIHKRDA